MLYNVYFCYVRNIIFILFNGGMVKLYSSTITYIASQKMDRFETLSIIFSRKNPFIFHQLDES